jgi:YhcH/YjgK/YiaL family protein
MLVNMNIIKYLFMIALTTFFTFCNQPEEKKPEKWSETKLNKWIREGVWKEGWIPEYDNSLNKREFAVEYYKNKDRWVKAFKYLSETKLEELAPGKIELDGENLFVVVQKYIPKNLDDIMIEAHMKYADIQYIISGSERIGFVPIEQTTTTIPYDAEKDVMYVRSDDLCFSEATPEVFFIFLPNDAHCPGIKLNSCTEVHKIVIKVSLE